MSVKFYEVIYDEIKQAINRLVNQVIKENIVQGNTLSHMEKIVRFKDYRLAVI